MGFFFDNETTRLDISDCTNPEFQKFIAIFLQLAKISNNDKNTFHYVKYNVKNEYIIDQHHDSCENTIVIFLSKDNTIGNETFTVGPIIIGKKVDY